MDQDWGKVSVTESATIKKFDENGVVNDITDAESRFPAAFVDSAPGYNLEYARAILVGLQRKPIYGGTVPHDVKEKRHARNARAKQSRKRNRG